MAKEYIERDMVLSHKWEVRVYDPTDPGAKMDLPELPKDEAPAGPYDLLYEEGGENLR